VSKIKGWTKLADSQAPVRGEPAWRNNRTGRVLAISRVEGGGGVVYVENERGELQNALGAGTGFRTFALAERWASEYRRRQP